MLDAELTITIGAVGTGAVVLSMGLRRVIHVARKWVDMYDVILGRPERYPNDPESKPGLIERLDKLDNRTSQLDNRMEKLERCIHKGECNHEAENP